MQTTQYTISELAQEFDITPRAIRFYEDQGLLAPSREGTNGTRRVFSARDRARLRLTLRGKRLGFPLAEIRSVLDLYESPQDNAAQLQAFLRMIEAHRSSLQSRLEDLKSILVELAESEAQCRGLLLAHTQASAASGRYTKETIDE